MSITTIAFTSCFDAEADDRQLVWDRIREHSPDILLLLGDTVYMDFGLWPVSSKPMGRPRKMSNAKFASKLYRLYQKQWAVESFRILIGTGITVGMTWDDHDFAWNNSRGAGSEKKYAVSKEKRLISRALFMQFKDTVRKGDANIPYPSMPSLNALLKTADAGIQEMLDMGEVRVAMLDGRSFRQDPNDMPDAEMHGVSQLEWAADLFNKWNGFKVICSGSVLTESRESWDQYMDYQWLIQQRWPKSIVLTGDIHKNVPPTLHGDNPPVVEVTSSGAARPGIGGNTGNYGLLSLGSNNQVSLFDGKGHRVDVPISW